MTKTRQRFAFIGCLVLVFAIGLYIIFFDNDRTLRQIESNVMTAEFSDTLDSYYSDNGDDLELEIYSAEPSVSPLKMIALCNYLDERNEDILQLDEEENAFRFEIEKSLYKKENCIDTKKLDSNASLSDFYHAIYVANKINDAELFEEVKGLYEEHNWNEISQIDMIYKEIIENYCGHTTSVSELEGVVQYVSSVAGDEQISIDFESLDKLKACIQYLIITDNNICVEDAKKIYELYTRKSNERYIIFDMDIVFEDYLWIINLLKEYTEIKTTSDLFREVYEEDVKMYEGVTYQITSPLNFACFVTGLAYQNRPISDNLYRNLEIIFEQIETEVSEEDYRDIYYLKYTADLLNIDYKIPAKQKSEISNDYYSLSLYNKEISSDEYIKENDADDVMVILSCADVCLKSDDLKEKIKNIDILSYSDENEFGMLLNLYTCVMLEYDTMTESKSEDIKNYIQSNKGMFGYEVDGAYDFRTSIYYTNIMYMLDGGEDIGLR